MIGRFSHQDNFRQLLSIREFYTVLAGGLLIAASYLLSNAYHNQSISTVLALSALALLGGPIIKGAITGLLERKVNVDELVSLAIIASVVIGEYISAAIVAFIMVLGSLLEKYVSEKARSAIHALIKLKPSQATVLRNGEEFTVPISEIRPGDIIIVHPGEQIPVDGIVTKGLAAVNQASLTGESLPADIGVGGFVYAGSIIQSGMLIVEAKKVGMDTTFGKLVQLVQEAERLRAPILRVADNYARYFTPSVIGLSLLAYLVTDDVYRAITVLIVGCPCAFILAAPTAVTAALGNAARNGVLIRGGALLEELGRIDAVVFDKTGTLTTGQPFIERVISLNGESQHNILRLAASAERYSEHPLAKAILEAAKTARHPLGEPESFRQIFGSGIEALVDGRKVFVGTISDPEHFNGIIGQHILSTGTCLVVKDNDVPIGYLIISSEIRPEVSGLVSKLKNLGIKRSILLTGDKRSVAAHVANISGMCEFKAELLPEQKLQEIKRLQDQGYKVAMVGDGINDAPSLAAANIGIAMGAVGTDVAIESADISLMADDLSKIPFALRLGKATLKTINHNIVFAVAFNLLAVIASSAGYLTPIMGAIVHNVGSVLVVVNSATLIRRRFGLST